jgi:hypothetical protein
MGRANPLHPCAVLRWGRQLRTRAPDNAPHLPVSPSRVPCLELVSTTLPARPSLLNSNQPTPSQLSPNKQHACLSNLLFDTPRPPPWPRPPRAPPARSGSNFVMNTATTIPTGSLHGHPIYPPQCGRHGLTGPLPRVSQASGAPRPHDIKPFLPNQRRAHFEYESYEIVLRID